MKKSPLMPPETYAAGFRRFLPVYPAVLLLLGLTYFFALRSAFEYDIGHFTPSLLFGLLVFFTIAGVLASAVPAWLARYTISVTDTPSGNLCSLFASVMTAVLAVILTIDSVLLFTPDTTMVSKLEVFTLPFLAVSALLPNRYARIRQLTSIVSVISVNLTMFSCYFDPYVPINSPVRNLTVITQAAVLLFLLSEARISFGAKSFRITVPFYVFSCGTCAALGGGIALGGLLNRLLTVQPSDPNLSALRLGLYLALAVLALSRLAVLPGICGKYTEPPKKESEKAESAGESSIT